MDINGKPFTQNASSVDITRMGARLQGVTCRIQHGDIIGIQHGNDKARFRVIWVARPGSRNEGQVGVHCVEVVENTFGARSSRATLRTRTIQTNNLPMQ